LEEQNYVTNDRTNTDANLANIQEINSEEDEAMKVQYVPRKSGKRGLGSPQELNIREEGLYRESTRSRDMQPMTPESEGNPSYFRENSSYYANSDHQYSRDSYPHER
jgi:hypothetical protein